MKLEDVIKVLREERFTPLTSVDLDCINETYIDNLKEKRKTIHIKIIMKQDHTIFHLKNQCLLNSLLVLDAFDNNLYIIV